MRVLTVIDSLAVGGAEQSLAALTPSLIERGIEMHVAYLVDRPGVGSELVEGGAILHPLVGGGGRPGAARRAFTLMRRIRPDLVHTTLYTADVIGRTAAWLLRIPVVSSIVTESYGPEHIHNPEYSAWKVRAAYAVDAATARFVDRFHAVSENSAAVMAQRLRIPLDRIEVIPRGRDPERLGVRTEERRRAVRDALGIDEDVPVVLAVARHYHMKGLDLVMRAFPAVRDAVPGARFLVAGRDGPATSELLRMMDAAGIADAVSLLGYRSDVPDLMSGCDVFVLPSRTEGSPGVLIEAMALEAPTVASDIPSVREIAGGDQQSLILAPVAATDAFAEAITKLLSDRELAATLAAAGRERFLERYTMAAVAEATVRLYERSAKGRIDG